MLRQSFVSTLNKWKWEDGLNQKKIETLTLLILKLFIQNLIDSNDYSVNGHQTRSRQNSSECQLLKKSERFSLFVIIVSGRAGGDLSGRLCAT